MNDRSYFSSKTTHLFKNAPPVLCAALILFHVLANVWWLKNDNHPIGADAALHMQFAELYYEAFTNPDAGGFKDQAAAMQDIHSMYPPLLHCLGAALWLMKPYDADVMTFANTVAFALLLLGLYLFCRTFLNGWQALLATCVASFTPLLYGSSRLFLQEPIAATCVVWAYWALVKTEGFRNTRWSFIFAVINGLGFLARWTTCLYYIVPAAVLVWVGLRDTLALKPDEQTRRKALIRLALNILLVIVISALIFGPWYLNNYETMTAKYQTDFAGKQGGLRLFDANRWACIPVFIINTGTFLPLFLVAMAGVPVALSRKRRSLPVVMSLLWLAGTYMVLTLLWPIKAPAPRHVVQLLPPFAILSVLALSAIPPASLRKTAIAAFVFVLMFQFGNLTFASYGPIARWEIPVLRASRYVAQTKNHGLVVYSDRVYATVARYFPAFKGINWVDRTFDAMVSREKARYYVTAPTANYQLLRLSQVDTERVQKYHWPLKAPLTNSPLRMRRHPSGLADIGSRISRENVTTVVRAGGQETVLEPSPVFGAESPVSIPVPCELEILFDEAQTVSALELTFADRRYTLAEYTAQYLNPESRAFVEFSPPVCFKGSHQITHYHQFDTVSTPAIRLYYISETAGRDDVRVAAISFYQRVNQPRPPILVGSGRTLEALRQKLPVTDYVVAADLKPAEWDALKDRFELADRFTANVSTHWHRHEISVLARKQMQPITFATSPHLQVQLSGGANAVGRPTLPWWRFAESDSTLNPTEGQIYWVTRLPAIADVSFGGQYLVSGIDIIPLSEGCGVRRAIAQYWDNVSGAWKRIAEQNLIDSPKYTDEGYYMTTTSATPWAAPIQTDRMRLTILEGGADPRYDSQAFIANVFIYGRKAQPDASLNVTTIRNQVDVIFSETGPHVIHEMLSYRNIEPNLFTWSMPVAGHRPEHIFEFIARSKGNGVIALVVRGKPSVVFNLAPTNDDLWSDNGITLAYRSAAYSPDATGIYRLLVPGHYVEAGKPVTFSMEITSDIADSYFAITPLTLQR